jgi:hypothetical protein
MADCAKYQEMISALLDGELSDAQQDELYAHLALCPECNALFHALQAIHSLCDVASVQPPEALAEGVMRQIKTSTVQKPIKRRLFYRIAAGVAAAACLALVLVSLPHILPGAGSAANDSAAADTTRSPCAITAEDAVTADSADAGSADNAEESDQVISSMQIYDDGSDSSKTEDAPQYMHTAAELNCAVLITIYGEIPFDLQAYEAESTEMDGRPAYLIDIDQDLAQQLMDAETYDYSVDRDAQTDDCIVLYYPD